MELKRYVTTFLLICITGICFSFCKSEKKIDHPENRPAVLVFSKTNGFRHDSIEKGTATIEALGRDNGFEVVHTEDSTLFTSDYLDKFKAVIFLSTTGDILNDAQQQAFENYIQQGGGFVGVHAAADTEYGWPWYNKLVGAWFLSHPKQQNATIDVLDKNHPSTKHLPDQWTRWDEWYNYKDINQETTVLMKLDENSYEGGENKGNHPIAWYHAYDGGRAFYTGLGHTKESYDEVDFQKHLLGGIKYAMGE
ncbi:ThuA domain-containing protein [Olivibacter sp. SDN3]|uniref:ThuA domain-containing protein n=1 Tax=Olivibacter sp. SDN3 TaxID=2764720 RepID=UPI001650EF68|nr:ThuA domain-containing protein [Olivibacter sp. SDN3]QNL52224.1 ThuA domain-containing protein [Olivibacter sp. SDN3]